jgi:hypothetical protein
MSFKCFFTEALYDAGFRFSSSPAPCLDVGFQRGELLALPTVGNVLNEIIKRS